MLNLIKRRRSLRKAGNAFTEQLCEHVDRGGEWEEAEQLCSRRRVVPRPWRHWRGTRFRPTHVALQARQLTAIRLDTEVMNGMEGAIATVNTAIKTAPMLGLLGTVLGMIGAFAKIAGQSTPDATQLGSDIALALNATAAGLLVAITLLLLVNWVIVRRKNFEDVTIEQIQEVLEHMDVYNDRHRGRA